MKTLILSISLLFLNLISAYSQKSEVTLYNPARDAIKQIDSALTIAKSQKKHVFIQVGGNWCSWCILFHKFYTTDFQLDSALSASYVVVHLNYSQENKNLEILKKLEFPQRFGFPVLVILDSNGKRLHTQNTSYLEEGRGYNKEKVMDFLKAWSPQALDPNNYLK
jgi:thioredoxin-related protein